MTKFSLNVLDIDAAAVCKQIEAAIRELVGKQLRRRGAVVGVSGGIDSAVCAMLASRALGAERVLGLLMPEQDSANDTTAKGRVVCQTAGIEAIVEDIAPVLAALGCYRRRDAAVRQVFPDFGPNHRMKITVADHLLEQDRVNFFNLVVVGPDGVQHKERMPLDVYLQVVAATNMKQRVRKLLEYHHAERLNYAVVGTPNRLEYDLGFFVRGGDGLADFKPIAQLYKTQVYALARYLELPELIRNQMPTTDTYSMPQTQEEFYYALPYDRMDLLLYAFHHDVPAAEAGAVMGLTAEQVERVYRDTVSKLRVAARLHQAALLIGREGAEAEAPTSGA